MSARMPSIRGFLPEAVLSYSPLAGVLSGDATAVWGDRVKRYTEAARGCVGSNATRRLCKAILSFDEYVKLESPPADTPLRFFIEAAVSWHKIQSEVNPFVLLSFYHAAGVLTEETFPASLRKCVSQMTRDEIDYCRATFPEANKGLDRRATFMDYFSHATVDAASEGVPGGTLAAAFHGAGGPSGGGPAAVEKDL